MASNRSRRAHNEFSFCDLFRSLDRFAEPITINHRGKDSYRTICGGCFSLLIALIVIAFAVARIERLIMRRTPQIDTGLEQYYTDEIGQTFDLKEQGVDIIVKVDGITDTTDGNTSTSSTLPLNERYGKIEAYNVKKNPANVE